MTDSAEETVAVEHLEELADEWEMQRTDSRERDKAFQRAAERLREEVERLAE